MTKPSHHCTRCSSPCKFPPLCGDCRSRCKCPICRCPMPSQCWCDDCRKIGEDIAAALRYEQVLVKDWEATREANIRCYRVGKMLPKRGLRVE